METAQIKNFVFTSVTFGLNVFIEMLHVHRIFKISLQFIHQPILAFIKNSFMHPAAPEEYKEGLDELLIVLSFISLNSCIMTKFRGR